MENMNFLLNLRSKPLPINHDFYELERVEDRGTRFYPIYLLVLLVDPILLAAIVFLADYLPSSLGLVVTVIRLFLVTDLVAGLFGLKRTSLKWYYNPVYPETESPYSKNIHHTRIGTKSYWAHTYYWLYMLVQTAAIVLTLF
jgi:hypothetical protein